jgi:hypothetical protein
MPEQLKKKSVLAEAKSWATKRGLFGTQAFLKYVIFRFTENLSHHCTRSSRSDLLRSKTSSLTSWRPVIALDLETRE